MAARTIDGPEKDWLDTHEVLQRTRLSESTLRREMRAGRFPQPVEVTKGIRMWHWLDLVYWDLRVQLGRRLSPDGQEPPTTGQSPPTGEDELETT